MFHLHCCCFFFERNSFVFFGLNSCCAFYLNANRKKGKFHSDICTLTRHRLIKFIVENKWRWKPKCGGIYSLTTFHPTNFGQLTKHFFFTFCVRWQWLPCLGFQVHEYSICFNINICTFRKCHKQIFVGKLWQESCAFHAMYCWFSFCMACRRVGKCVVDKIWFVCAFFSARKRNHVYAHLMKAHKL